MLLHLDAWDRTANRRASTRRSVTPPRNPGAHNGESERREGERRAEEPDTSARRREQDEKSVSPAAELPARPPQPAERATTPSAPTTARATPAREEAPLIIVARTS
jgi:hypothetical protein